MQYIDHRNISQILLVLFKVLEKKKLEQKLLHEEIMRINAETVQAKERQMEEEKLAEIREMEFQKKKLVRLQADYLYWQEARWSLSLWDQEHMLTVNTPVFVLSYPFYYYPHCLRSAGPGGRIRRRAKTNEEREGVGDC